MLKTRRPSGKSPWPLILIEGSEKTGKTYACAQLTASDRISRSYWLDIGEGSADEYGLVPGADYEIIEHDGTWGAIIDAVADVREIAEKALANGEGPVLLVIDSMTAEWELLKTWTASRARSSRSNKKKLAEDSNAEIVISHNYWNDSNDRHRKLMKMIMTFPGPVVVTARGKEVAAMGEDGRPIEGQKDYSVEGQKALAYDAAVWVRLSRKSPPTVVGIRAPLFGIRPGIDNPKELPDLSLENIIFNVLGCGKETQTRDLVNVSVDTSIETICKRAEELAAAGDKDALINYYYEVRDLGKLNDTTKDEDGKDITLEAFFLALGSAL